MEQYEDEAMCKCGAWVPVCFLRESPRVQSSSTGVRCLECNQVEVQVGYNWIRRNVSFVRYQPLSVNTKSLLKGPPKLYLVLGDRKSDAVQKPSGTPVPRNRRRP